MKQTTFASLSYQSKKKQTIREKFLTEMDQVVPWAELIALIEPHCAKKRRRGRSPVPLQSMLRIYFMQQWYAMSDPAMEDALYEIESIRHFAGLELIDITFGVCQRSRSMRAQLSGFATCSSATR